MIDLAVCHSEPEKNDSSSILRSRIHLYKKDVTLESGLSVAKYSKAHFSALV